MLKIGLGQFFIHIYGFKVKKVHKSVVNFAHSLSAWRHSSALLSVSFVAVWLFCATFAVRYDLWKEVTAGSRLCFRAECGTLPSRLDGRCVCSSRSRPGHPPGGGSWPEDGLDLPS